MHMIRLSRATLGARGRATLAILLVAAMLAAFPAITLAKHAPTTLYVGAAPAGDNSSCSSPGYSSVQSAVEAAPSGATVYLCSSGSPYVEAVDITGKVTLTGDPGATIQAPSVWPTQSLPPEFATNNLKPPAAVVLVWGTDANATISGLTIAGPFQNSCGLQDFGVLALSGATVTLSGDTVTNIQDINPALRGCQNGVAIQIGREYWPEMSGNIPVMNFVGHATISGTTVIGYQKNGITVDGPGSTADLSGNTVTGAGRVSYTAQNGIQISRGAGGQVRNNVVSGNAYTGGGYASAGGILVYGGWGDPIVTGVQIMGNTLVNNDVGVYLVNYNDDGTGAPTAMTNNKVVNNTISNDAVTNICTAGPFCYGVITEQAGVDDVGNNDKIINNDISGDGYISPLNDPDAGVFILPVDTISFPTTAPKVHANSAQ